MLKKFERKKFKFLRYTKTAKKFAFFLPFKNLKPYELSEFLSKFQFQKFSYCNNRIFSGEIYF